MCLSPSLKESCIPRRMGYGLACWASCALESSGTVIFKCGSRTKCISITWMYQKYSPKVQPYKRTYGSSPLWAQNQQVEPRDQRVMDVLVLAASKERPQILQSSVAELSRQGILLGDIPASMLEGRGTTRRGQHSPEHAQFKVMLLNHTCSKMVTGDFLGWRI